MRKIFLFAIMLVMSAVASCQSYSPVGAYLSPSAGVWNPWSSAAGFGALGFTPQPVALYCQASAGAAWTPCTGGGGSGTFNALTGDATSTSTGGATEVVGLLNHLLPSLTTGYLNYTGSAWALSPISVTFDQIGSGTNLGHGLVCGTGCVFTTAGTGVNNANELGGVLLSGLATGLAVFTAGVPTTVAAPAGTVVGTTDTQTLSNKTFTTPNIGAATGTSLLVTGNLDGTAPVTITTGTTASLGGTFRSGYTYNQEATAATAVAYTLPTAAAGRQYCVGNSYNGTAANTGVLTVNTSASGQFVIFTDGTLSATGGNVTSGGAGGDAACFVGVDATHWQMYLQMGAWSKH